MMANLSTLIFLFYAFVAGSLTFITGRRLLKEWSSPDMDVMHIACRIGILFLTGGTLLDNSRTFFGTLDLFPVDNFMNVTVAWFCVLNHQVLAAFTLFTPSYFVHHVTTGERTKYYIKIGTTACAALLFLINGYGFLSKQPNPLLIKSECEEIDGLYMTLSPSKKVPNSLLCVFAYQFAMIGCGIFLIVKRQGCCCCNLSTFRSWELAFFIANFACLPGQALLTSLGPYYRCYGSNFWEQVTFASAVYVDYIFSEEMNGKDSDISPLEESLVEGNYIPLKDDKSERV